MNEHADLHQIISEQHKQLAQLRRDRAALIDRLALSTTLNELLLEKLSLSREQCNVNNPQEWKQSWIEEVKL